MSLTPEQETLSAALTNLQRLTVLGVVEGKSQRQAYRDAGGKQEGYPPDKGNKYADLASFKYRGEPDDDIYPGFHHRAGVKEC